MKSKLAGIPKRLVILRSKRQLWIDCMLRDAAIYHGTNGHHVQCAGTYLDEVNKEIADLESLI